MGYIEIGARRRLGVPLSSFVVVYVAKLKSVSGSDQNFQTNPTLGPGHPG
jgi:hypothetical protein